MNSLNLNGTIFEYSQRNRAIRLRLAHGEVDMDDVLVVARLSGQETLCGGLEYRVDCSSTKSNLPLKMLIALPAELQFVEFTGIAGEKETAKFRKRITDPHIKNPIDTG
jgi:type VI secretion system secreted protein VgrG